LEAFRCPMFSAMHRFEACSGSLNSGEQKYEKRRRGTLTSIYQTNQATGASYYHPDNCVWFDHDSFTVGADGVGWDANLLCDETFIFTIVYCPAVQCRMSEKCLDHAGILRCTELDNDPSHSAQSQKLIGTSNKVCVTLCGVTSTVPIESSHVEFFGAMRVAVIGKARTSRQFQDHVSRCKIQAADKQKNRGLIIDAQQLDTISRYSFWIDFEDQHGADESMIGPSYASVIAADALYREGGSHILRNTMNTLANMFLAAADTNTVTKALTRAGRVGLAGLNGRY